MMKQLLAKVVLGVFLFYLGGCLGVDDLRTESTTSEETGIYNESDEDAYFGEKDFVDEVINPYEEDEVDCTDDLSDIGIAEDPDLSDDGINVYFLNIVWGMLKGNPDYAEGVDYDGSISLSEGSEGRIWIKRLIRFEHLRDYIVRPRENAQSFNFESWTGPHNDGLLIKVVIPKGEEDTTLSLNINLSSTDQAFEKELTQDELSNLIITEDLDTIDNQISLVGFLREKDGCNKGFFRGRWYPMKEHFDEDMPHGFFRGRWIDFDLSKRGFMRGKYFNNGTFKGKVINLLGRFKVKSKGTYADHELDGEYHVKDGDKKTDGYMMGIYANLLYRRGGFFAGIWENYCDASDAIAADATSDETAELLEETSE